MDYLLKSKYSEEKKGWLIEISGEIDIYNSSELKKGLNSLIDEKNVDLFIDCKSLEYIDSTGLGSLVSVLKKVKQYDGNIVLYNLKSNVSKVFRITELDKVFVIEGGKNE